MANAIHGRKFNKILTNSQIRPDYCEENFL